MQCFLKCLHAAVAPNWDWIDEIFFMKTRLWRSSDLPTDFSVLIGVQELLGYSLLRWVLKQFRFHEIGSDMETHCHGGSPQDSRYTYGELFWSSLGVQLCRSNFGPVTLSFSLIYSAGMLWGEPYAHLSSLFGKMKKNDFSIFHMGAQF